MITADDAMLTIEKVDEVGSYFILPGGGQEAGEPRVGRPAPQP